MRARTKLLALLVPLAAGAAAATASAVEIVGVVRGDLVLAKVGEQVFGLRLAGIWVPTPPGLGEEVGYRGAEARQFVIQAIDGQKLNIVRLGKILPGRPIRVRILLGKDDPRDLAVMLAEAGLALCDKKRAANAEHGEAIYRAERRARAARRGMHDGGYAKFQASSSHQELYLGVSGWLTERPSDFGAPEGTIAGIASGGPDSWWATSSSTEIHKSAGDSLLEYGDSLGLSATPKRDRR